MKNVISNLKKVFSNNLLGCSVRVNDILSELRVKTILSKLPFCTEFPDESRKTSSHGIKNSYNSTDIFFNGKKFRFQIIFIDRSATFINYTQKCIRCRVRKLALVGK